jgi:outer membrane protein OmpA-like peptidoglycan-associated protein
VDLRHEEKIMGPQTIDLFQNIELSLSVYDNEIFRPLDATVVAESLSGNGQKFEGKKVDEGIYTFSIPMGQKYRIKAEASKFDENSFEFDLNGDIIFSRFERNLPLIPRKKAFEIIISDKDTEEGLMAEVIITNLNREETIFFSAQDVKDGKITAMLREGDQYEFTIRGAQGYSFHNQVVDLAKQETSTLTAELVSLKAQTSIRLNNINFGSNSADLTSESFPELNRVVQLIKDNPAIVIEIAAHTDNVGSGSYNMVLSEKRAQSVVHYLLDNSVAPNRLVAKGYGLKSPMVPNTSDENRALNRRVEFKILEILSE